MIGLAEIAILNAQATREARRLKRVPYMPTTAACRRLFARGEVNGLKIPFLADHVPPDWERTDADLIFVDITGFGEAGGAALTTFQLARVVSKLPPDIGVAIVQHNGREGWCALYRFTGCLDRVA